MYHIFNGLSTKKGVAAFLPRLKIVGFQPQIIMKKLLEISSCRDCHHWHERTSLCYYNVSAFGKRKVKNPDFTPDWCPLDDAGASKEQGETTKLKINDSNHKAWAQRQDCDAETTLEFTELHPAYPGAVWTASLRGVAASGNNTASLSTDQDVVSYIARNYYEATSSEASLQDYYVALRFMLPENFNAWAQSNAIQIEFRTESGTYINSSVDVYIYKSGVSALVTNSENNSNTIWSTITVDDSALGSWSSGDILEIYLKLKTRNDYYARIGKIRFNYTSDELVTPLDADVTKEQIAHIKPSVRLRWRRGIERYTRNAGT